MTSNNLKIYQLKITLKGSKPPIWRRIQVKSNTTLGKLHRIIQIVMGWGDYHLHQFIIGKIYYGIPDPDFGLDVKSELRIKLDSLVTRVKQLFIYEYDFGDSWEHKITVEKIVSPETDVRYPICIGGKLACPPEDCGGIWGYYDLLEIIQDPNHPEYEDMLEWLGEEFNPKFVDTEAINRELKNIR